MKKYLVNHDRLKTDACGHPTPRHGDHNLLRYSASLRIGLIHAYIEIIKIVQLWVSRDARGWTILFLHDES